MCRAMVGVDTMRNVVLNLAPVMVNLTAASTLQGLRSIRALSSHQREKLFLVRVSKDFMGEMSLELEFPTFYRLLLSSAVRQTLLGTGDTEIKVAHLCSWKSSQPS